MYALINNFNAPFLIISKHYTVKAANAAQDKYNRAISKANNKNSYIPTTIMRCSRKATHKEDCKCLNRYEVEQLLYIAR